MSGRCAKNVLSNPGGNGMATLAKLSDIRCRQAKCTDKLTDGGGLYLLLVPQGQGNRVKART